MRKQYYYSDELNDDFATRVKAIKRKPITEKFKYYPSRGVAKFFRWFIKRLFAPPVTRFVLRIVCRVKYVNMAVTKPYKKSAAFIYGNHVGYLTDALNPTYIARPRQSFTVVNEDSVSIFGIKHFLLACGALPIPDDFHMMPKFTDAMDRAVEKNGWIAVYPEAHIWEWYTKIRPFPAVSFRYPVRYGTPVFTFTLTFQKKKHCKKPRKVVYVDGPFFPDGTLAEREAAQKLRDECHAAMCAASQNSDCEYVEYVFREKLPKIEPLDVRDV